MLTTRPPIPQVFELIKTLECQINGEGGFNIIKVGWKYPRYLVSGGSLVTGVGGVLENYAYIINVNEYKQYLE